MNPPPVVAALGVVDAHEIAGTAGVAVAWKDLGATAPGNRRVLRELFGHDDENFRRLDRAAKTLVLAAAAAGLERTLPRAARDDTALVIETTLGSTDSDLRFSRSMRDGMCDSPLFPYTLPSACVGDVALRHGVRGPTLLLSVGAADAGAALRQARWLLATGEASYALAGCVDALAEPVGNLLPACRAVVALVAHPACGLAPVAEWPEDQGDPYGALVAALDARRGG
jgi:3-oxoacyl-[acyl-carrier-protein] synthase II